MKEMRRIVAFILCLVMLVGTVPMGALAAEETEAPTEGVSAILGEAASFTKTTEPAEETVPQTTEESVPETTEETVPEATEDIIWGNVNLVVERETTRATNDTIYVLAGGDFQEEGDHANSAANVTDILAQISQKYATMNGFLFIGDYDCETHDDATETANGITALMGAVQGSYSNINNDNSVLVQGNHDYMDSRIDATGGHEFDAYSVYVLNEDDYPNGGGSQSGVQTLANNLKTWLNNKIGEGYSAPIFITSHLPLAFTPRTATQGDAKYAKYIFDVLNDAAANGLNIIFLHGHDHAYGPDNYMGGEAIYLPVGDKICIAEAGSTSAWTEETLNFTYMNAGYVGYYSDPYTYVTTAGTDKLTMTVFAITNNQVTVERYSANGLYNLKSAGYDGSYSDTDVTNASLGLPTYSAVYASPQTIALTEAEQLGTIGSYVEVAAEDVPDDVTTSGSGWTEITPPVSGNPEGDNVTPFGGNWETITQPQGGTTKYQAVLDQNGVDKETNYVIASGSAALNATATNNGYWISTNITTSAVTISGTTATATTQPMVWKINDQNQIYTTIDNETYYLYISDGSLDITDGQGWVSPPTWTITDNNGEYTITTTVEEGNFWDPTTTTYYLTNNGVTANATTVGLYTYTGTITEGGTNGLYGKLEGELTYNVGLGTDAETALQKVKDGIAIKYHYGDESAAETFDDDGDGMSWILDTAYGDGTTPGDYAVTIKYGDTVLGTAEVVVSGEDVNGLYGKLVGDLSYEVTPGTSADDALAAVKAGIDGYYYQAMSEPGSDVAGTKVEDSALTWTLADNYDPNTPGDYEVTISYVDEANGINEVLGTAEVVVPASAMYYVAEGNGLYIVDMNTSAENAMDAVKAGVTVYSATDANGTNKTAISDDDVTWNWVDTYNGADSGPYTVEILYNGTSLGTVEVKVNVKYETEIKDGWTHVGTQTGGYKYVLDTDGIEYGEANKYIIVDDNEAIALHATSSANGTAQSITIDGTTATTTTRDYEYHFIKTSAPDEVDNDYDGSEYELITKGNGSSYLYQQDSGVRYGTRSSVKFQINHHGSGIYDIHDIDGTNWYVVYNGSWTVVTDTNSRVRLYKYDSAILGGNIYAKIEGNTVYTVEQGTSTTQALAAVKAGITGYISNNADGSDPTELEDSKLTWKWKNNYNGNVTGSYWVEISYNGVVLGTVEVVVEPAVINNYPEYPNEGAVNVHKTATGIDFQSSGIAQVELSASGVPVKKGADVIIMLDTSSSMAYCLNCSDTRHNSYECDQGGQTRAQALEETLADLIAQFKTPGDDGQLLDIDVAIADFNGFYGDNHSESGTPYDRDAADMMSDKVSYTANSAAQVYTNDTDALDATAFVAAEDLAPSYPLSYASGTNYDYAFDAIYQMATAKKIANGSEDRDLFVIFMSDGAGMQWNYYHSQGSSSPWNSWITGAWSGDEVAANLNCTTHAYYYDEVDHDGDGYINEHRMANAIKGDPSEEFEVIRKSNDLGTATDEENMYMVPGLGAKLFSIAFDPRKDGEVTVESITKSIASLASDQTGTTRYFYDVSSADALATAFSAIGAEIAYAASNARFVDQVGDNFNLQMETSTYTVVDGGTTTTKTLAPVIEVLTYDIYTKAEADADKNDNITEDMIGDRKNTTPTLQEVVMFSDDGTKAYSNLIDVDKDGTYGVTVNSDGTYTVNDAEDNIIGTDGVIYAKTFVYNTTATDVTITNVNIPTGTNADGTTTGTTSVVPSETFYWKLGTVQTSELALRYYVYLEGSMDGTREAGSYSTNEFATLYYDNYLGNPAYKDTVSPVMAWKEANVSYAFYLVDENGNIIVNQTTGQTGTFANKIAVTKPVVYKELLLNSSDEVVALDVAAISEDVLPKYYELYDPAAKYTVNVNSNGSGNWVIEKGSDALVASTYVTEIGGNLNYSNALSENDSAYEYSHTVVWFAVKWSIQAHPDTVVIDYGLPVDISVLANDMFGDNGKLAGVGEYTDGVEKTALATTMLTGFDDSYSGTYGVATVDKTTGKVRYTPSNMQMNGYEKFAYAVNYTGTTNPGYYYDTVTVIPATTIYYEDKFVTYSNKTWDNTSNGFVAADLDWTIVANGDQVQDEDRPGEYSLTDANNIYGYDSANLNMTKHSLGGYAKATVDYDNCAIAEFDFYGTGFDVISLTNSDTGTITVKAYPYENGTVSTTAARQFVVDTYYGFTRKFYMVDYTYTDGEWKVTTKTEKTEAEYLEGKDTVGEKPSAPDVGTTYTAYEFEWIVSPNEDVLYQVPVMKMSELPYGKYHVVITAIYDPIFEHVEGSTSYDFYLDAIRIYDPANDGAVDEDTVIEDAYKADGEGWPAYIEVRNKLIKQETLGNADTGTVITGLVFIDGDAEVGDAQLEDYISYGPDNEVYLAPGQRIAFMLDLRSYDVDNIHIGIKSADGEKGTYTITNIAANDIIDAAGKVITTQGKDYNAQTFPISTTTDMYYDLTGWKNDIIVISNTGNRYNTDGIISITNIKFTFNTDPSPAVSAASFLYMTPEATTLTLRTLNRIAAEEQPEETVPEETVPETTVPETSVPEETVPETTVPEETVPETTVPEETEPEATEPEPDVFEPEVDVKLSSRTVKAGGSVIVTVTTDGGVDALSVNGKAVARYMENRVTGKRTWIAVVKASEVGQLDIEVNAYNAEGIAAETVTESVTVTEKSGGLLNALFGWLVR